MERKTIGQFIAALRRVNGMTQKQLAEKLNVSDKAVSRWERDECAPDLTLIPVIAEIFNITSDELLRGERIIKEEPVERAETKTEKQLKHVLDSNMLSFKMRSILSICIAVMGLVVAMICNFGFLRAYIGFYSGIIFVVAAAFCQVIFGIQIFATLSGGEFDAETVGEYRFKAVKWLQITLYANAVIAAFMLPLVLEPWDTFMGINASMWFAEGAIFSIITGILGYFAAGFVNSRLANAYNESARERITKQSTIVKTALKRAAKLILITVILHITFNAVSATGAFMKKIEFTTTEEFKTFMETPVDANGDPYEPDDSEPSEWYIFDRDGNEIDVYFEWNQSVAEVMYDWDKGSPLYIVHTIEARNISDSITETVNGAFVILYIAELVLCFVKTKKEEQ